MVKQKLLENKRNMLKVRRIERNALGISNTSNFLTEILLKTVKSSYRLSVLTRLTGISN